MITILVGPEKTRFHVHEAILKHTEAGYLSHVATQNGWRENSGVLELPEDDAAVFKMFSKWLYNKSLNPRFNADWIDDLYEDDELMLRPIEAIIYLYCFAHKNGDTALQEQLTSFMFKYSAEHRFGANFRQESLGHLVEKASNSHMHNLLTKWMAAGILSGSLLNISESCTLLPVETLRATMRHVGVVLERTAIDGINPQVYPKELMGTMCDYHSHGVDEWCQGRL